MEALREIDLVDVARGDVFAYAFDGRLKTGTATGTGTLDAVFRAIEQLTGVSAELEDFTLAAATQGSDALGEAVVTLSQGSHVVIGRALALDVIEAAANAYVNALNWLVRPQQDLAGAGATEQRQQ